MRFLRHDKEAFEANLNGNLQSRALDHMVSAQEHAAYPPTWHRVLANTGVRRMSVMLVTRKRDERGLRAGVGNLRDTGPL